MLDPHTQMTSVFKSVVFLCSPFLKEREVSPPLRELRRHSQGHRRLAEEVSGMSAHMHHQHSPAPTFTQKHLFFPPISLLLKMSD